MRVGYFTSYYPATSHTFIRREIEALEAQGVTVFRYALRADPQGLVEPRDVIEEKRTKFIFKARVSELFRCFALTLVKQPIDVVRVFTLAAKIGHRSDRGMARHFAYVLEAIVLSDWCRRDAGSAHSCAFRDQSDCGCYACARTFRHSIQLYCSRF